MSVNQLFPNAKEVTESFGAFEGVAQNIHSDLNDPINIFVIGDGCTPRTAATFAYRSRWTCWSIDPAMREKPWASRIDRLSTIKAKIEDLDVFDVGDKPTVIIHMHAHVRINQSIDRIRGTNVSVLACPCCVPQFIENIPHHIEYRDPHIHSPHNLIKIWKGLNTHEYSVSSHLAH